MRGKWQSISFAAPRPEWQSGPRFRPLSVLTVAFLTLLLTAPAAAAFDFPAGRLAFWVDEGAVPPAAVQTWPVEGFFFQDDALPVPGAAPVWALALHGRARLVAPHGYVRVTLVDSTLREHLVAEVYGLLEEFETRFDGACRESCLLPAVVPHRLRIELSGAELELERVELLVAAGALPEDLPVRRERIRSAQAAALTARINERARALGLGWEAGETDYSRLSFEERKLRSASGRVPVLHGFEYYVGGVFAAGPARPGDSPDEGAGGGVSPSASTDPQPPVARFDWRQWHDADLPASPYFDGDAAGGGWMTPVREQGCSDCWAYAAIGALEASINLSLNRHRDVDLAEQHLLSCSGAGDCSGGSVQAALQSIVDDFVAAEPCFPYAARELPCEQCCEAPVLAARLGGFREVALDQGEDGIKRALLTYGPLTFGIRSWWHYMVLVGYGRDPVNGRTVWIVKNSWGPGWGEDGYGRLETTLDDVYGVYALVGARLERDGVPLRTTCRDADGDGYAAWGLGVRRPADCPVWSGPEDCNDADPRFAIPSPDGRCLMIDPAPPDPDGPEDPQPQPPTQPQPPVVPASDDSPAVAPASSGGGGGACGPLFYCLLPALARRRARAKRGLV